MEQSIEAVEHQDSLEGAMDYLLSLEGEGEIFHRSTLDEGHRYPEEREMEFVEESQEERTMYAFLFILFHTVADNCRVCYIFHWLQWKHNSDYPPGQEG